MEACRILAGSIEHLCQSAQVGRKGTISVFIRRDTAGEVEIQSPLLTIVSGTITLFY